MTGPIDPSSGQPLGSGPDPYAAGQPPYAPPVAGPYAQPAPGVVASGMYLDPVSGLLIPQGTVLAPVGRRIGAFFLSIPLFIVTLGIGYVIWGLVVWSRGQTPALQVLKMRCWRPQQGRPATFWWMALREIVGRLVDGILGFITQLVSLILLLTTKERKCLHDMVAGTIVLHDPGNLIAA
jgi:uncharacterized RDD family membrane protein YckC